jgi:hypothetical protein
MVPGALPGARVLEEDAVRLSFLSVAGASTHIDIMICRSTLMVAVLNSLYQNSVNRSNDIIDMPQHLSFVTIQLKNVFLLAPNAIEPRSS